MNDQQPPTEPNSGFSQQTSNTQSESQKPKQQTENSASSEQTDELNKALGKSMAVYLAWKVSGLI
jgi:hypothetical protein